MDLYEIPGRAFLDTSSLNFILEYGENIFDGVSPPTNLKKRIIEDINAFYNIFLSGQRLLWQLAISPLTYSEIMRTQEPSKKYYLERWFTEVWDYWLGIFGKDKSLPSLVEAEYTKTKLLLSRILDILPDVNDRILICDAVIYKCDCFCTRDWKTLLKHRDSLASLPIKIVTPTEWWNLLEPYARL